MTYNTVFKTLDKLLQYFRSTRLSLQRYFENYVHFLVCFENKVISRNMHVFLMPP